MRERFGRVPKRIEQLSIDNLSIKVLRSESRMLRLLCFEKAEAHAAQGCVGELK